NVYRVVYEQDTLRLDEEATEAMRVETRKQRLAKARPFADFVRDWSKLSPPAEALRYYGTWPNPRDGMQPSKHLKAA
ncbi:MAG: hypothetical protein AB7V46_17730, partial [Thermomicrobiales bacterium]